MKCGRGVAVGLVVLVQLTGCTAGHSVDGEQMTAHATSTPVGDHRAALAREGRVLEQIFPTPTDAVGLSQSAAATGTDTPDGWRVQGFTSVAGADVMGAGAHHVHVACVGSGSLTVTTRLSAGTAAAPQPATTPRASETSLAVDCTPDGVVGTSDSSLAEGDPGVEMGVVPAADTVATVGYAIS